MAHALIWCRRDLRLDDNPALQAALRAGLAPIFVYVHAPDEEAPWAPGAATRAWLHRSLAAFDADLQARGSRLLLRRGEGAQVMHRKFQRRIWHHVLTGHAIIPPDIHRPQHFVLAGQ